MLLLGYFTAALLILVALTAMILAIARALGDCPTKGPRARAAGISLATGFLALGGGAVLLIGAGAALGGGIETIFFCLGLACVVLGLGFTQAVTLLRAVIGGPAQPEQRQPPASPAPGVDPFPA